MCSNQIEALPSADEGSSESEYKESNSSEVEEESESEGEVEGGKPMVCPTQNYEIILFIVTIIQMDVPVKDDAAGIIGLSKVCFMPKLQILP